MTVDALRNGLNAEAEHPLSGPVPDGFCENYAFTANDPRSGHHLLMCMGTQPFDSDLWHEMLQLRAPGGGTLVWKSAGRGGSASGGGGATVRFTCEAPGERWRLRMAGFGQLVPTDALSAGPVSDGPWVRVGLDLEFVALGPAWVLSAQSLERAQETSAFHYEQSGTVRGAIDVAGVTHAFDGTGHRDHSRGPRDFASVHDHAWIDCAFPSGRAFAVYRMRLAGGADGVAAGAIVTSSTLVATGAVEVPLLAEDASSTYTVVLDVEGHRYEVAAEIVAPLGVTTYVTPNHMVIGHADLPEATQVVHDGLTRFEWDREVGYGHTQRSTSART